MEKQRVTYEEKALVALQRATQEKAEALSKAETLQVKLLRCSTCQTSDSGPFHRSAILKRCCVFSANRRLWSQCRQNHWDGRAFSRSWSWTRGNSGRSSTSVWISCSSCRASWRYAALNPNFHHCGVVARNIFCSSLERQRLSWKRRLHHWDRRSRSCSTTSACSRRTTRVWEKKSRTFKVRVVNEQSTSKPDFLYSSFI